MAELDTARQSLTLKIVYYGPALSGKTTNLQRLHDLLSPELKGDMMTLDTRNDRTLFFDLVPLGFRAPSGLLLKFKLFTVPGQVAVLLPVPSCLRATVKLLPAAAVGNVKVQLAVSVM